MNVGMVLWLGNRKAQWSRADITSLESMDLSPRLAGE